MGDKTRAGTRDALEVASLFERMGYLQALRVAFIGAVLAASVFAFDDIGAGVNDFARLNGLYAAMILFVELLRRIGRAGTKAVASTLLLDGLFLAAVTYATGGTQSPLRFLLYMHLIAVTLLASYRTGLKVALWHSILLFVVFHAELTGVLDPQGVFESVVGRETLEIYRPFLFHALAFWLVALGSAAFSSQNERELRRRKVDLEMLAEMAKEFENLTAPSTVANELLDRVTVGFEFTRGVVLGGQDDILRVMAQTGTAGDPELQPGLDAAVKSAWESRDPLLLEKLDVDDNPVLAQLLPNPRTLLIVPLVADGHPLGVIVLEQGGKDPFIEQRVISIVSQFASHGALAIRNAWLLEQVQKMAETDALTGVANRRAFEKALDREISRATRSEEQLTLVMLDIDHFKVLNDSFGHQAGDEVLQRVGAALRKACRDMDTPARYGGEEFAILLPSCSATESLSAASRLRRVIGEIEAEVPVTVSAGVATFPVHAASADELVQAADEALYESKRSGRNRATRSSRGEAFSIPLG